MVEDSCWSTLDSSKTSPVDSKEGELCPKLSLCKSSFLDKIGELDVVIATAVVIGLIGVA